MVPPVVDLRLSVYSRYTCTDCDTFKKVQQMYVLEAASISRGPLPDIGYYGQEVVTELEKMHPVSTA